VTTCVDIDECSANTDNCSTYATCANTAGSFTCECNANYHGDGTYCQFVDQVTIGDKFQCVRTRGDNAAAHVYCWGDNTFGQLGDGTTATRNNPKVKFPVDFTGVIPAGGEPLTVRAGANFACATFATSNATNIACWGDNSSGQLGANATALAFSKTPVVVTVA
jgi:alpha-tubulin suppressor-like RCC1 family protein